jgi:hypothetical protein
MHIYTHARDWFLGQMKHEATRPLIETISRQHRAAPGGFSGRIQLAQQGGSALDRSAPLTSDVSSSRRERGASVSSLSADVHLTWTFMIQFLSQTHRHQIREPCYSGFLTIELVQSSFITHVKFSRDLTGSGACTRARTHTHIRALFQSRTMVEMIGDMS